MKPAVIKGTVTLLGAGGLSVGGYYGFQTLNSKEDTTKNNISNKLEKDGYVLLTSQSQNFEAILGSYKSIISNKDELKLGVFNGENSGSTLAKDILLEKCSEILKKDFNNNDYKRATKWCVEPITVSALLKKQTIKELDVNAVDGLGKEAWRKKINKHKSKADGTAKITGLNLDSSSSEAIESDYQIIKDKCKALGAFASHTAEFEDSLVKFKDWCTE